MISITTRTRGKNQRHCKTYVSLIGALISMAGAASEESSESDRQSVIPMQMHKGYSSERCIKVQQQSLLSFSLETPFQVEFNIHHHTDTSTEFPVKRLVQSSYSQSLTLASAGEYCFMWMNPASRPTDYSIDLQYTLAPL